MRNWDSNTQLDIAVLDFSKAFDTVPHDKLLGKLTHYGIHGHLHGWITNFLKCREQSVVVDGTHSSPVYVESGVPQGTVLGPILFLLHINDLPDHVTSSVRLFADDCLLYRPIRSQDDQHLLQEDINSLTQWCSDWGMSFNADKCEVMRVTRKSQPLRMFYTIKGQVLQEVTKAKYLGITITDDLQWSTHIANITKKANSNLAFLRRNLKDAPPKVKETAYLSLVRSLLEYSCTVWDPHLRKDTDAIEMVQRRAARMVRNDYQYDSSVTEMLSILGWDTLSDRRRDAKLTLLYKIINHLAEVPTEDILVPADPRTRANHSYKFKCIQAKTTVFRHSFFVSIIPDWNNLTAAIVESPTLVTYKSRLKSSRAASRS